MKVLLVYVTTLYFAALNPKTIHNQEKLPLNNVLEKAVIGEFQIFDGEVKCRWWRRPRGICAASSQC